MTEQWLPIPAYEGFYEVSDHGRVRSVDRRVMTTSRNGNRFEVTVKGKELTRMADRRGAQIVNLCRGGKPKTRLVHQLVLETFVGPRPEGTECCHYDDDPTNNVLSNLRWDTRSNNLFDSVRNGRHRATKARGETSPGFVA